VDVHCLELDVVTQGDSAENAVQMLDDALNILAYKNMKDGRPPFELRSAPPEDWELYRRAEPIGTHLLRIKGDVFSDDVTARPKRPICPCPTFPWRWECPPTARP
jgi:hypothetical protein